MGGYYRATRNNGGQGDPFGAASHLLGHAGTGRSNRGVTSMGPSLVPSLGPIGQGTTAAEPPWGQGPTGGHLVKVPDHVTLTMPANFCFMNFVQKCPHGPPEVPHAQARDPGHGAQGPKKISVALSRHA